MCNVMAYQAGPDCSLPSQMTVPNKVEICRLKISKIPKLLDKHNLHYIMEVQFILFFAYNLVMDITP